MSRILRKEILNMVSLLNKANRTLKTSLGMKQVNRDGVLQLLADCQDVAVAIGNEMEMVYREKTEGVQKVQDYCSSLYQMSLALRNPVKRKELLKDLVREIQQLRELVDQEIPDRLEVVFLPHKASMWNSLENIWASAEKDENCDVYVVPVPYYERNVDGSFGSFHYEGEEFPENVPVKHYEQYAVEKRWPDVIYIQNPFDQDSDEDSVDPRYYSYELKKYTGLLVYVPDCFLGDKSALTEDRGEREGLETESLPRISGPACSHVDYIMVPAEEYRGYFDASLPKGRIQVVGVAAGEEESYGDKIHQFVCSKC